MNSKLSCSIVIRLSKTACIASALAVTLLLHAQTATADGAYKWVDKEGRVFYGTKPPKAAAGVDKLNLKPLSRYNSDKMLRRLGRARLSPESSSTAEKLKPEEAIPSAADSALKASEPKLEIDENGDILSSEVEVTNPSDLTFKNISIALEFPDGTLIPTIGPNTLAPSQTALFKIPSELLPLSIGLPEATDLLAKVVIHGEGSTAN